MRHVLPQAGGGVGRGGGGYHWGGGGGVGEPGTGIIYTLNSPPVVSFSLQVTGSQAKASNTVKFVSAVWVGRCRRPNQRKPQAGSLGHIGLI